MPCRCFYNILQRLIYLPLDLYFGCQEGAALFCSWLMLLISSFSSKPINNFLIQSSVILLPIVGNAAEHAGAIIFAYKNKLGISLGVSLGSATQISIFMVPLCVIIAWMMHIEMELRLSFLETGSFAASVITVAFALQDGSSHYMKGAVLLFGYMIISACFFVLKSSPNRANLIGPRPELSVGFSFS